ncbi:MAG: HAD family hydrolase [Mariprofundaceae bacterium]
MSSYHTFPFALAENIRLLILDVDGVLTDGGITLTDRGEQLKTFHVRDGHGLKMLQRAGIQTAILTGRTSQVVEHRAKELGISIIQQGCLDKAAGLEGILTSAGVDAEFAAYIGDDIVDLPAMRRCRFSIAPKDAHCSVLSTADWQSGFSGGCGAVRQATEGLILATGHWPKVVASRYGISPEDCGWPSP